MMFDVPNTYRPKLDTLRRIIQKRAAFPEAMALALDVHAMTHGSEISPSQSPTYEDDIRAGLSDEDFARLPAPDARTTFSLRDGYLEPCYTLAWHFWHITRIEDLVGNILIRNGPQVFDAKWAQRLAATATDTGNAMPLADIAVFSKQLKAQEFLQYRFAVGKRTRAIIQSLVPEDMKRKPTPEGLSRLMTEGGLTEQKESKWLLDFWGNRTVGGLILLPLTGHHVMHLDACVKLKNNITGR